VAAELEEAEAGPKDGWSGPSTWMLLVADGEPTAAPCVGGQGGGRCSSRGAARGPGEARNGERIPDSWWLGCGVTKHTWSEQRRAKRKQRSPSFRRSHSARG
jgi:hypothetical protein